jgi:hypothetical protein
MPELEFSLYNVASIQDKTNRFPPQRMADIFTLLQRQVSRSEIALSGKCCARRAYVLVPPECSGSL